MIVKANESNVLVLGRPGENETTTIVFDITPYREEFGIGDAQVMVTRPGESEPYPVALTKTTDTVEWTTQLADVFKPGKGRAQLTYYVGGKAVKSTIYTTMVLDSLQSVPEPPEPMQGWVEQIVKVGAQATVDANKAKSYAVGGTGTREGEDTDNAKYYSEQAKASETAVTKSVEEVEKARAEVQRNKESVDKAKGEVDTNAKQVEQDRIQTGKDVESAKASEENSRKYSENAKQSESNAKTSEDNAKASELAVNKKADGFTDAVVKATETAVQSVTAEGEKQREILTDIAKPLVKKDYVDQNFANSFVQKESGIVITSDMVSSVEHNVLCSVESDNLIPFPYKDSNKINNGITWTVESDGSVIANGTATGQSSFTLYGGAEMKVPYGVYLSGCAKGGSFGKWLMQYNKKTKTGQFIYISDYGDGSYMSDGEGISETCAIYIREGVTVKDLVFKPKIGKLTPWNKRVPLEKTKLWVGGNNLWSGKQDIVVTPSYREKGIIVPYNALKGELCLNTKYMEIETTNKYSESGTILYLLMIYNSGARSYAPIVSYDSRNNYVKVQDILVLVEKGIKEWQLGVTNRFVSGKIGIKGFMISKNKISEYESYKGTEYSVNPDGSVDNVKSVSPNMTMFSDTEGVLVNAQYNLDGRKYIDKKVAELESKITNTQALVLER